MEQVNPRSVHSEVVCLIPRSFITRVISLYGIFVEDDRVVRPERADADRVIDRHERFDARTECAVVLLPEVIGPKVGAFVDEVLNDRHVPDIGRNHQSSDAVIVGSIHVLPEVDEQLHDFESLGRSASLAVTRDEARSARRHQHRLAVLRNDLRVGAMGQQKFHQFDIAGECSAHQGSRKDDSRRSVPHARARRVVDDVIHVGAGVEKLLDQRQADPRSPTHGKVRRRFHVAAVDRPEERRESLRIGLIHVGVLSIRNEATSYPPLKMARPSASLPSPPLALICAPAATSMRADSRSPSRAANINGVSDPLAFSSAVLIRAARQLGSRLQSLVRSRKGRTSSGH